MKPINLVISAFGPYADAQTIDFRELGGRRFFLIHGPTGGGKTTILDAMCYALYGDTSGKERDGEQMRCQMAKADVRTEVTFDFAIGEKQYRVTRKPRQERPRKRGEGTTTEMPSAELWDRTGVTDDAEGNPLATQPTKVTEQVSLLLGFRSEQFRQVIVLPQDKFRELLLADSAQREDILQTLFRTSFYEQVQEALKERAKGIAGKLEIVKARHVFVLEQAAVASSDELKARQEEKRQADIAAEVNLKLLRDAHTVAEAKQVADQQTGAKFLEHRTATDALNATEQKQSEIDKARVQIDAADRARKVAVEESALRQRQQENNSRKAALKSAVENEKAASTALEAAQTKLKAEETKKAERERFFAEATRIDGLRDRVLNLEIAASKSSDAKARLSALSDQLEAAKRHHEKSKLEAETVKGQRSAAQSLAASLEGHRLAVSNSQKELAERTKLAEAETAIATRTKQLAAAKQKLDQAQNDLQAAKAASADVQRAWINGQAARLAKRLVDGEPCPVCGSTEHSFPATSVNDIPSDEQLQSVQEAVDQQSEVVKRDDIAVKKLESELAVGASAAETYRVSLGNAANEELPSIQMRLKQHEAAFQRSHEANTSIPSLAQKVNDATKAEEDAKLKEADVTLQYQQAVAAVSAAGATLVECRNGVPEKLTTVALLDAEVARIRRIVDGIDSAMKLAIEAFNKAQQVTTAMTEMSKSAQAECVASDETLRRAKDDFERKRTECGFALDAELTAAKLTDVQIRGIRERVEVHAQALSAAKDRAARAAASVAGLKVPDLESSKLLVEKARQDLDSGISLSGNLKRDMEQIEISFQQLDGAAREMEALRSQYAVIGRIAEVADGKNNAGLKFSRFVLGFLLDDVLIAATERLKIMSKGRYQLQRRKERADMRSHGGLDLEVFDAHSGYARAAATLSGGESFLASLSLALGLADVVQAQAGGIRMETMFIDEGFGSLDSETLDLAVNSLIDLFKDGRLVGIISHVAELQERMDARLEIMRALRGSSARFVVS